MDSYSTFVTLNLLIQTGLFLISFVLYVKVRKLEGRNESR
jgi:hypothetical protein